MRLPVPVALLLIVAGCGGEADTPNELERLDRELAAGNGADPARDPALLAALGDPIMVDPQLTQGSNANAIRPPDRPDTGATAPIDIAARAGTAPPPGPASGPAPGTPCPECRARAGALTLGALAERQANDRVSGCAARIGYSATWANRLPAAAPLYPDARVIEAAGTDAAGCSLRVVTFRSSAALERVAGWYVAAGRRAGYSAGHRAEGGTHLVGGARGEAAFLAYLRPRADGGTDVDLLASG